MTSNPVQQLKIVQGDITTLPVDAIVTAANESLRGGAGVDGAVHRAAGPGLLEECKTLGICPEGEARITRGHLLPARHIIHTVGPVWEDGLYNEAELLRSCYFESLRLALENGVKTIAFPCIATGVFGYPKDQACKVALDSCLEWLRKHPLPMEINFCCFGSEDFEIYKSELARISNEVAGLTAELS